MNKCPKCGSSEEEEDSGQAICRNCGAIKHNSNVVANLSFDNCAVMGNFGNKTGTYTKVRALYQYKNVDEFRLNKAYRLINDIASSLEINQNIVKASQNLYKYMQQKNWVQGRHTDLVVAACMYVNCRHQKDPHLLIDFADKLQVNLYKLGTTYLKLIKELHFSIPNVDPCLYIWRFCEKLDFGEKKNEVGMTALRILKSMKRDWMFHGRRPTGLVGAAILIAARYHGFKRTTNQIIQTVHVCDETIRKRLVEFKQTDTAKLSLEEFKNMDLLNDITTEKNPPSFKLDKSSLIEKPLPLKIRELETTLSKKASIIDDKMLSFNRERESTEMERKLSSTQIVNKDIDGKLVKVEDEENDKDSNRLSEFSDTEIDEFILTEEESILKSHIWHQINSEWLQEQRQKQNRIDLTKKHPDATQNILKRKKKEKGTY